MTLVRARQARIQNEQIAALLTKMSRRYYKYWDDANLVETMYSSYMNLFDRVEGDFEQLEAYVECSIRNKITDHRRAVYTRKRRIRWEPLSDQIADQNPSPESAYLRQETVELVKEVLDTASAVSSGIRDSLTALLDGDIRNWCTSEQGRYAQQRRFGFSSKDFRKFRARAFLMKDRIENSFTYAVAKVKGTTVRVTKSILKAIKSMGETVHKRWNRWEDRMGKDVRSQYASRISSVDVIKKFDPKEWFGEEIRRKKVLLRYYPRRNKKNNEKFYVVEGDRAYKAQDGSEIRSKVFFASQLVDFRSTLNIALGEIKKDTEVRTVTYKPEYLRLWESHKSHICPTRDAQGKPKPPTKVLGVNHVEILLWKHRRVNGNCYYTCRLQWSRNGKAMKNFYHSQIPLLLTIIDEAIIWMRDDLKS